MTHWNRPSLFIVNHVATSAELLAPLYPLYGAIHVHLIDGHDEDDNHVPVPRSYVDSLKAVGFRVYGVVGDYRDDRDTWGSPRSAALRLSDEILDLGLAGGICNFEDAWEARDTANGGDWSLTFVERFRLDWPRKPLALNTYDECGGINLRAWADANARLYLQSYKGGVEPPAVIAGDTLWRFAKQYGWPTTKRGFWRPCLGVFKDSSGERVPIADQIAAMKAGRSVGFSAYYCEGADLGEPESYLAPLARAAIAAGVAR